MRYKLKRPFWLNSPWRRVLKIFIGSRSIFRSRSNSMEIEPVVCLLFCANYKLVDVLVFEILQIPAFRIRITMDPDPNMSGFFSVLCLSNGLGHLHQSFDKITCKYMNTYIHYNAIVIFSRLWSWKMTKMAAILFSDFLDHRGVGHLVIRRKWIQRRFFI